MRAFIYGTLKRDESNHHIIERTKAKFISEVVTSIRYPLFQGSDPFPYLIDKPGEGFFIKGELFEIDESQRMMLDHFEGCPDLYKPGKIAVAYDNKTEEVDCYFMSNPPSLDMLKLIDSWSGYSEDFNALSS